MSRLETMSSELFDRLRQTSDDKQRQAAIAACHFAQAHSNLQDPLFLETLQHLHNRQRFSSHEKSQIETLVSQLDEQYFRLYAIDEEKREAADNRSNNEREAAEKEYMKFFLQARAAACLLFAMDEDSFLASTEAIYEAAATTETDDELKEFFDLIRSVLSRAG